MGGAIFANDVEVTNSIFSDNEVTDYNGTGGAINTYKLNSITSTYLNNKANDKGGAVFVSGDSSILNGNFQGNSADKGGAIYSVGNIDITNVAFGDNRANIEGGAVFGKNAINLSSSTFANNIANSKGGAVASDDEGDYYYSPSLAVQKSIFFQNSSDKGGAIFSLRDLNITESTFTENSAKSYGGAVLNESYWGVEVSDSVFAKNRAEKDGGAVFGLGGLGVSTSYFTGNSATNGGAIFGGNNVYDTNISISNSIFSQNLAYLNGGAVYSKSEVKAVSSNFVSNDGFGNGGAIYSKSDIKMAYSVVANQNWTDTNSSNTSVSAIYLDVPEVNGTVENNLSGTVFFSNYLDVNSSVMIAGGFDINDTNITSEANIIPTPGELLFDENFSLIDGNSSLVDMGADISVASDTVYNAFGDYPNNGYLVTDFNCNSRIGDDGSIDIGAIEYGWSENNCSFDKILSASQTTPPPTVPGSQTESTEEVSIHLNKGWNLISADINLSEIPTDIAIVWTYSDGNWSAFSPDPNTTQAITDEGTPTITQPLTSNTGVWFLSLTDFDLTYQKPANPMNAPTIPNVTAQNVGWNLLGTDKELTAGLVECRLGEVGLMWKFSDGKWWLNSPDVDQYIYPYLFNTIKPNEGFWVLCK
ncbi:MAG TPA: hypothetical protein EYO61_02130 [Campylobacterales bacterium]|nr:hypothetical protein [Campylobacterales bacterium]